MTTLRILRAHARWLVGVLWGSACLVVAAQGAPQKPTPPVEPPPPAVQRPAPPEAYSYRSEGRRDPFLSLVGRGSDTRETKKKPEGVRGLSFDEIALRGIMQTAGGAVAIVQAPDTKTYRVRVGDQFYDAVIKAITADSIVVLQEVNDPLSLQKQRERRKTLRVVEEVK
jgi:Tfp pilus assembly protein PilP